MPGIHNKFEDSKIWITYKWKWFSQVNEVIQFKYNCWNPIVQRSHKRLFNNMLRMFNTLKMLLFLPGQIVHDMHKWTAS